MSSDVSLEARAYFGALREQAAEQRLLSSDPFR
jgi:hypothetical protein